MPRVPRCLLASLTGFVLACSGNSAGPAPASSTQASASAKPTPESIVEAKDEAAAAPPPYDLAADLDARKVDLGARVGKKTKFEVVDDVFLIAAPSGQLGASAVVTKQALKAYFNGRFTHKPERAIAVLLFDQAPPYEAYCQSVWKKPCITPYGVYEPEIRTVIMNAGPGIGTLTHELVHPLVEADFPEAPTWINEGIASLYEAFNFPKPGEIRGNKNFRHPALLAALKSKKDRPYASLPTLFAMSDTDFRGPREGLNYAIARYFCQWMDSQNQLWPFYHSFRDHFATDPTGEKAFLEVMKKTPADLDETWAKWVRAL